jgi:hypothetical protein
LTSNLNTEIANRVSGDSALNTRVDNLTSSTNSLQAAINSVASSLSSESSTRNTADEELLKKIDMLFLYLFHRKSEGAVIDGDH